MNPLAERLRPKTLEDVVGQDALVGPDAPLGAAARAGRVFSAILWGPPGTGKTTIARLLAERAGATFEALSAVTSGVKDVRAAIERARGRDGPTVLFVDEVHRFNRAQQDAFLHAIEEGTIVFLVATTENPSFSLNAPLLSRAKVFVLAPLSRDALAEILARGEKELGAACSEDARELLLATADGDARALLTALDIAYELARSRGAPRVEAEHVVASAQRRVPRYDASGEEHFNAISALHKSVRASDPDAAVYWLARMLEAGEDPLYVARRLVRIASEDVGNADPRALGIALAAKDAVDFLGMPEASDALAQCTLFLACAAKSNRVHLAYGAAAADVREHGSLPVPLHLRNAPTRLMKQLGYGAGYVYDHDVEGGVSGQPCLPPELADRRYYEPASSGFEERLRARVEELRRLRGERR